MGLKAVFFDLDDTLVSTSKHDERAYAAVREEAERQCKKAKASELISDYKACLKQQPWDPGYPEAEAVSVTEHRAKLWAAALQMQPQVFEDELAEVMKSAVESAGGNANPMMVQMMSQCAGQAFVESQSNSLGDCFQETFDRQRLADFALVDGAAELIGRLRAKGLAVVIITSGHEDVQRPKLQACRAADVVGEENIIVGGEELRAGREDKPHASIFLKACAVAGCEPSEAVMVGDSLQSDIQGAINANLAASIWVNAAGNEIAQGAPQPSAQVASVLELEAALNRLELLS